jgi:hypothetical protein
MGIFFDNCISSFLGDLNDLSFGVSGAVAACLILYIYSSKYMSNIEKSYEAMSNNKQIVVNIIFYSSLVLVPAWDFISYRLYMFGEI